MIVEITLPLGNTCRLYYRPNLSTEEGLISVPVMLQKGRQWAVVGERVKRTKYVSGRLLECLPWKGWEARVLPHGCIEIRQSFLREIYPMDVKNRTDIPQEVLTTAIRCIR